MQGAWARCVQEKRGGLAAVASQKWHSDQSPKLAEPKVARDFQAYVGTWFMLPAQITDKRLVEAWKQYPRDAAARKVAGSHAISRASWSRRDHERGFEAKVKFDASMLNNYDFDEPEFEGDIAVDKEVRRWMRNSYEAEARLREARAR